MVYCSYNFGHAFVVNDACYTLHLSYPSVVDRRSYKAVGTVCGSRGTERAYFQILVRDAVCSGTESSPKFSCSVNMVTEASSDMIVFIYRTTRRHLTENP